MPIKLVIKQHSKLSGKEWDEIAFLKDQHWPHGPESQKAWIAQNFEDNDVHIIGYLGDTPVAYASLNAIHCVMDSKQVEILGLGGVCVDLNYQKQGLGRIIVECANEYITAEGKAGLLLCHHELTGFYSLCGWKIIHCEKVYVADADYKYFVMSIANDFSAMVSLVIPKNF